MAAASPRIGGGSNKHRAGSGRIPIADGDSEGSQMRSADGYKIPIGGGGYSWCVVVLRASRLVSYFPSFRILSDPHLLFSWVQIIPLFPWLVDYMDRMLLLSLCSPVCVFALSQYICISCLCIRFIFSEMNKTQINVAVWLEMKASVPKYFLRAVVLLNIKGKKSLPIP